MTDIFKDKSLDNTTAKPEVGVDATCLVKEDRTADHMPWPQGRFPEHGVQSVRRPRFGHDV